ncbi:MAG: hypothetical protein WDW36_000734 [Sanguina aurantia]
MLAEIHVHVERLARGFDADHAELSGRRAELAKASSQSALFAALAVGSVITALGFSYLQELVFDIEGFKYGGWMTFLTWSTYAICGAVDLLANGNLTRNAALKDYALISVLAMSGAYLTNWALTYLNYTTRIVFKSCRIIPVMVFRTLIIGQRYSLMQYGGGLILVAGISLFTMGDAEGMPNFNYAGVGLIAVALERLLFRIKVPAGHAEVMLHLSVFAAAESFLVITATGELPQAVAHSVSHPMTVPCICAFSALGYITVSLVLLLIKNFGATSTEIVKSMRKVCQVALSFAAFPKPFSWKYVCGGGLVALALLWLHLTGKKQLEEEGQAQGGLAVFSDSNNAKKKRPQKGEIAQ